MNFAWVYIFTSNSYFFYSNSSSLDPEKQFRITPYTPLKFYSVKYIQNFVFNLVFSCIYYFLLKMENAKIVHSIKPLQPFRKYKKCIGCDYVFVCLAMCSYVQCLRDCVFICMPSCLCVYVFSVLSRCSFIYLSNQLSKCSCLFVFLCLCVLLSVYCLVFRYVSMHVQCLCVYQLC